jgi:hypothetical protein
MRVENTKLPYLWLLLPPLMRILPFVLILGAVSDSQKAIGYIAIYFGFASASVFVRRGFRINAIFPRRVPIWIANSMNLRLAAITLAWTCAVENLPVATIIAFGIGLTSFSATLSLKVFLLFVFLNVTTLWIGFRLLPFLVLKNVSIGDVKQSIRYIFLGLSSLLIVVFRFSTSIPDVIFAIAPFGYVPLVINSFYGDIVSLYIGLVNFIIYSFVLSICTRRNNWNKVDNLLTKNYDEEADII